MSRFTQSLAAVERFRVNMTLIVGALVLIGTLSLKYPLVFIAFLIVGLIYSIYRIIKDLKKEGGTVAAGNDTLQ